MLATCGQCLKIKRFEKNSISVFIIFRFLNDENRIGEKPGIQILEFVSEIYLQTFGKLVTVDVKSPFTGQITGFRNLF